MCPTTAKRREPAKKRATRYPEGVATHSEEKSGWNQLWDAQTKEKTTLPWVK